MFLLVSIWGEIWVFRRWASANENSLKTLKIIVKSVGHPNEVRIQFKCCTSGLFSDILPYSGVLRGGGALRNNGCRRIVEIFRFAFFAFRLTVLDSDFPFYASRQFEVSFPHIPAVVIAPAHTQLATQRTFPRRLRLFRRSRMGLFSAQKLLHFSTLMHLFLPEKLAHRGYVGMAQPPREFLWFMIRTTDVIA